MSTVRRMSLDLPLSLPRLNLEEGHTNRLKSLTVDHESGSMKRKRSLQFDVSDSRRAIKKGFSNEANDQCPLIRLLSHYPIVDSLTSYLFPSDLDALSRTSNLTYSVLFPDERSRSNLHRKMPCDGSGIEIRQKHHKKSKYFYRHKCTEYAKCGADDQRVKSKACDSCDATTCDECRIHCIYQSIWQPPEEPDELPWYSGFALLDGPEMGVLSPSHLGMADGMPWNPPYHDQGFLDIPLDSDTWAPPEEVKNILDVNLGTQTLGLGDNFSLSYVMHPSAVIRPFWEVTEQRKRSFCPDCFRNERKTQNAAYSSCGCTLQKRYLDRWLCLKCYCHEQRSIKEFPRGAEGSWPKQCSCGEPLDVFNARVLCLWCFGEVKCSAR